MYGAGSYLYYNASPIVNLLSIAIMFKYRAKPVGLVKSVFTLAILAFFSSTLNFAFVTNSDHNYIQYVSYGISAYLACVASYSFISHTGRDGFKILYFFFLVIYVVGIYWYIRSNAVINSLYQQNNTFYYILTTLPLLLCIKNKPISILFLLTSGFICVFSTKRSAVIAILLIIAVCLLNTVRAKGGWYKAIIVALVLSFGSYYLINNYLDERLVRTVERMEGISEDGGSGRTDLFISIMNNDLPDLISFPAIFIGKGFSALRFKHNLTFEAAHNDYWEILYSYGIIGFVLLLSIFKKLFGKMKEFKPKNSRYAIGVRSCFIIMLTYSFLGNAFFFFCYFIVIFIFLGAVEALSFRGEACDDYVEIVQ